MVVYEYFRKGVYYGNKVFAYFLFLMVFVTGIMYAVQPYLASTPGLIIYAVCALVSLGLAIPVARDEIRCLGTCFEDQKKKKEIEKEYLGLV